MMMMMGVFQFTIIYRNKQTKTMTAESESTEYEIVHTQRMYKNSGINHLSEGGKRDETHKY